MVLEPRSVNLPTLKLSFKVFLFRKLLCLFLNLVDFNLHSCACSIPTWRNHMGEKEETSQEAKIANFSSVAPWAVRENLSGSTKRICYGQWCFLTGGSSWSSPHSPDCSWILMMELLKNIIACLIEMSPAVSISNTVKVLAMSVKIVLRFLDDISAIH